MPKLKNIKKAILGLVVLFLFFPFFSPNAISATTIGDTTFHADVGKTYTWKATYPAEAKGVKFSFKSDSIEQGVKYSMDVLMVNCTMRVYYPTMGWNTYMENELYITANNTLNHLLFYTYMGGPVVIPTPLNLSLLAEAEYATNYSVVDNTVFINSSYGESYEYTYNDEGILTIGTQYEDEIMVFRFVLDTGGSATVPLGNYFLIFIVISVIALVYLKKQKIK